MKTPNPFLPPSANLNEPAIAAASQSSEVPPSVIAILGETRPWLRLMLGLFVTVLALLSLAVLGVLLSGWFGTRSTALALWTLVPLALVMSLYVPPAIYLGRCAHKIRLLQAGAGLPALEDVLRSQKSFWKYLGILALVLIAVYALAFVAFKALRT